MLTGLRGRLGAADRRNLIRVMPAKGAGPMSVRQIQRIQRPADVLVIGGGVIGLAIAWRAAQRGLRVTRGRPEPRPGRDARAAGMLTPLAEAAYAERELFQLGPASLRRYPGFAAELTELTGLPTGLAPDRHAPGRLRRRRPGRAGGDPQPPGIFRLRRQPADRPGVPPGRADARPRRSAAACWPTRTARSTPGCSPPRCWPRPARPGCALVRAAEAAEACPTAAASPGRRLADGSAVAARRVVLAAGWQSAALAGLPPGALPPSARSRARSCGCGRRAAGMPAACSAGPCAGWSAARSVYLVPRADGELVVGATQEELGPDTTVTAGGVWELLRDARLLVPGITEFELAEAQAGLRPGTPDNAPAHRPRRAARPGAGHRPLPGRGAAGPGDRRYGGRLSSPDACRAGRPVRPGAIRPAAPPAPAAAGRPRTGEEHSRGDHHQRQRHPGGRRSCRWPPPSRWSPRRRTGVAAALNGDVIRRGAWESTRLAAGDQVEVVTAVQGG